MYRRIVAAAALSLSLFACGSSAPAPATSSGAPQPTPTTPTTGPAMLHIMVATTGAVTESGSYPFAAYVVGPPRNSSPTCAQFTAASPQFYTSFPGTVAGNAFDWVISVAPYTGPGTYTSSEQLPMQVSVDAASASSPFQAPSGANGAQDQFTLTTKADGSGSFVFTDWHNVTTSGPGPRTESGTITWTCSGS